MYTYDDPTLKPGVVAPCVKLDLFLRIMQALVEQEVRVALLNGYDPKTQVLGRDVDLLVHRRDVQTIIRICQQQAESHGWNYLSGRWVGDWLPKGLYQLAFHRENSGEIQNLAIDLICSDGIAAGIVPVYSPDLLETHLEVREGLPTTMVGTYTKNLIRVLAGDPKGIATVEELGDVPEGATAYLTSLLGEDFVAEFGRNVKERSLVTHWRRLRKKAQQAYWRRQPLKALRNAALSLARKTVGVRIAHVPTIAIVGPDGVGKSTAIEKATQLLGGAFMTIRNQHWRPKLLPNIADLNPKRLLKRSKGAPEEGVISNAPRREAGSLGAFRVLYYYADYLLGHIIKDRLYLEPDILVNLYDRCSLDMYVDPVRYGLRPGKPIFWIYRFSPKPDWVILLSDSADAIYARKTELPYEEIVRQTGVWVQLYQEGHVHQIIKVGGRSADEVARDIAAAVLKQTSLHKGQGVENC